MIHAYDEIYLAGARKSMGIMLDLAVNEAHMDLRDFYAHFLNHKISLRFAQGDPGILAGKSGNELFLEVMDLDESGTFDLPLNKSPEYWTGWALAYYQWLCGISFQTLDREVPIDRIRSLYHPYHEMDISQFADQMQKLRQANRLSTYLKYYRKRMGCTQKVLSDRTGIPLKTIQQYEQGQKDINKAQAETVLKLAQALCCNPMDLLEN